MLIPTVVMVIVALVLLAFAYGQGVHTQGLNSGLRTFLSIFPLLMSSMTFDGGFDSLELNLISTINLCYQVLPMMKKNKWGRIIAITSVAASPVVWSAPIGVGQIINNLTRIPYRENQ